MVDNLMYYMFLNPDFQVLMMIVYHFFMEVPETTVEYLELKMFPNT